jgi:hypothetical protein
MAVPSHIERRPDGAGNNRATYPAAWGTPPTGMTERRAWAVKNIKDAQARVARGEPRPDWLDREIR